MDSATVATTYALNVTLVGVTGTIFGMPIDALVLGAFGGAVVLARSEPMSRKQAISVLGMSMMLAGSGSPAAVAWLVNHIDLGSAQDEAMYFKALAPFAIGAGWQWFMPFVTAKMEKIMQSFLDKGDKT